MIYAQLNRAVVAFPPIVLRAPLLHLLVVVVVVVYVQTT